MVWRLKNIDTEEVVSVTKDDFRVGRNRAANLICSNDVVSKNQAALHFTEEDLFVVDNGSSNGTFINNKKIPQLERKQLQPGDEVGFGMNRANLQNVRKPIYIFNVIKVPKMIVVESSDDEPMEVTIASEDKQKDCDKTEPSNSNEDAESQGRSNEEKDKENKPSTSNKDEKVESIHTKKLTLHKTKSSEEENIEKNNVQSSSTQKDNKSSKHNINRRHSTSSNSDNNNKYSTHSKKDKTSSSRSKSTKDDNKTKSERGKSDRESSQSYKGSKSNRESNKSNKESSKSTKESSKSNKEITKRKEDSSSQKKRSRERDKNDERVKKKCDEDRKHSEEAKYKKRQPSEDTEDKERKYSEEAKRKERSPSEDAERKYSGDAKDKEARNKTNCKDEDESLKTEASSSKIQIISSGTSKQKPNLLSTKKIETGVVSSDSEEDLFNDIFNGEIMTGVISIKFNTKPKHKRKMTNGAPKQDFSMIDDDVILVEDDEEDVINFMHSQLFIKSEPKEIKQELSPINDFDEPIVIDDDDDNDDYFNYVCSQNFIDDKADAKKSAEKPQYDITSIKKELEEMDQLDPNAPITVHDSISYNSGTDDELEVLLARSPVKKQVEVAAKEEPAPATKDEPAPVTKVEPAFATKDEPSPATNNELGFMPMEDDVENKNKEKIEEMSVLMKEYQEKLANLEGIIEEQNKKKAMEEREEELAKEAEEPSTSKFMPNRPKRKQPLSIKELPISEALLPKKRQRMTKIKPPPPPPVIKPQPIKSRHKDPRNSLAESMSTIQKKGENIYRRATVSSELPKNVKDQIRDERNKRLKEIADKQLLEKPHANNGVKRSAPKKVVASTTNRGEYLLSPSTSGVNRIKQFDAALAYKNRYMASAMSGDRRLKMQRDRLIEQHKDILDCIIIWNHKWIEEQKGKDVIPPVAQKDVIRMCNSFGSFKDYCNVVEPLIITEFWFNFCKDFEMGSIQSGSNNSVCARIVEANHFRTHMELVCTTYVDDISNKQGNHLREKNFVIVNVQLSDKPGTKGICKTVFGVVAWIQKEPLKPTEQVDKHMMSLCKRHPTMQIKFNLIIKNLSDSVKNNKNIVLRYFSCLPQYLRMITSLRALKTSPLVSFILEPKPSNFYVPIKDGPKLYELEEKLNESQIQAVHGITNLFKNLDPGIFLVEGPPGTGKSAVIIASVLEMILRYNRNKCVLLLAPSNGAIDSLILKLMRIKPKLGADKSKIKLVRIGNQSAMNVEVQRYTVEALARKNVDLSFFKEHAPAKRDHNILLERIKELKTKLAESPQDKTIQQNLNKIQYEFDHFVESYLKIRYAEKFEQQKVSILQGANLICSTVMSSTKILMPQLTTDHINICIIDEASQNLEPETLIPLAMGINKLVLVGDPQQLPAVASNILGKKYNFNRSLFARLKHNLSRYHENVPITLLNTQYRMHPEISSYPNRTFYNGQIKDHFRCCKEELTRIKPYLVFSQTKHSREQYQNVEEVEILVTIIKAATMVIPESVEFSIGIITPYARQREMINFELRKLKLHKNISISCNTVDGFQGQEKDFILISCVRNHSNSFLSDEQRLNVALTRAKYALYIIGTESLLEGSPVLRKLKNDADKRKVYFKIQNNLNTPIFRDIISTK